MYSRTPIAAVHEIIRKRKHDLTITRNLCSFESELLIVSGAARKFITAWFSVGVPWGVSRILRNFVERGEIQMEEWSHLGLALRYQAAAMGVPFLPTLSMLGSDYTKHLPVKEISCPFTDRRVLLVPALFPDITILHVQRADRYGNVQIDGMPFLDREMAMASSKVIVTTEKIVDINQIRAENDKTFLPFFVVDAVVEVPYGAYPGECQGLYEPDFDHIDEYVRLSEKGGVGVKDYLDKYISQESSFDEFLASVPPARITKIERSMKRLCGR